MTYVNFGIRRQSSQHVIQRLVHLFRRAFEEAATSADEQGVSGKDGSLAGFGVLEEIAYAVLSMTGRVQSTNRERAERECTVVRGSLCDRGTVFTANDGQWKGFQNLGIAACVVMVAEYRWVRRFHLITAVRYGKKCASAHTGVCL